MDTQTPGHSKLVKRVGVTLVALAFLAIAVWYVSRPQPVGVSLITAELGAVTATVTNTRAGTVDACRRAGLSPPLGGQIALLPVTDGDTVEQGQLLLELWNDDLRAQLDLAHEEANASQSRAEESCVIAAVARREADRLMSLREDGLASEEDTERAVGNAQARAAACTAARDGTRVSAAQVKVAEAALERTRLTAPFAGIIAEINGELGEFVTPSPIGIPTPPTVDLIDSNCLYISAPIDEVDAPLVRPGLSARISLDAFADRTFSGHVRRVAPYVLDVERQARTVEIEAEINDPDKSALLPGYSADVEVLLAREENVLRIPTAVIINGNEIFVYDADSGRIEHRMIEIGVANWEYTQVLDGLDEGELVVSSVDREGVADGALAEPE
ncbi:MAG: efflux RND transporter periplasmic adaptor subunit [Gammaproteobacteria bacterium]|nr:efflux RND transporter periplasmic adaptor subunit [Gammaproteobacteria bacterium]MDH3505799.1 efflux RND transporter periplasmic adaptor subunit [Gammaproteobacteria bacterium]